MCSGSPDSFVNQENTVTKDFDDNTGSFDILDGTRAFLLLSTGTWASPLSVAKLPRVGVKLTGAWNAPTSPIGTCLDFLPTLNPKEGDVVLESG